MAENSLLIEDVVGSKAFDQLEALELNLDAINAQVEALVKGFSGLGRAVEAANDIKQLSAAQQQLNKAQQEAVNVSKKQAAAQKTVTQAVKDSAQQEKALQSALNTTAKSIKEAREQNKLLTAARNATNVSTKEGVARLNELNAKIDANNAMIKANGDQALKQKMNIGNYASALSGLPGILGKVGGGMQTAATMTKSLGAAFTALIATPIGAMLAAIAGAFALVGAGLKAFYSDTEEGQKSLRQWKVGWQVWKNEAKTALQNIGGAFDTLLQKMRGGQKEQTGWQKRREKVAAENQKIEKATQEALEKTDNIAAKAFLRVVAWKEQLTNLLRNTTGEERAEAADAIKNAADAENSLVRIRAEWTRKKADLERDYARYREQVKNYDNDALTRQEALNNAGEIAVQIARKEYEIAKMDYEAKQKLLEATPSSEKDIQETADAYAAMIAKEEELANVQRSLNRERRTLEREISQDRAAELKDYTDNLKAELDNQVAAAKAAAEEAKAVYNRKDNEGLNQLDDVNAYIAARNKALEVEYNAEVELARKSAAKEIEIRGLTGDEALQINEKMEADLLNIAEKYGIKRETLANENARLLADATAGQIKAEQQKITNDLQAELDRRQVVLSQKLADGEITYKEYHKAIEDDQRETLAARLKAAIAYYKKLMTLEGVSVEQQRAALAELAKLYDQVSQEAEDGSKEAGQSLSDWWDGMDWEGRAQTVLNVLADVWGAVSELVGESIQNQITDLDNQQKRLDKNYEKRLEQVKSMGLTSRQEELETERIEREHEAETEKIEEEKAALQTKQAKWNKANSIVQAAINGALAITAAYAQNGPIVGSVFAAIVGAITAAQIAAIAAQKIPEYAEGRKGGKAELAIVGDGGRAEVIESRGGEAYVTPAAPTLTRLAAGDRVWPSVQEYL
ncbi:MAG: hypothetical protein NC048_10445, partial [Bacteroides sp.]|nr:hypothetical protein [Bacteroides sp.]